MNNGARTICLFVFLALALAGCATTPKIDWRSRIGTYTYDQAITELGPPDKAAKLTTGATVAEWLESPAQIIVTPQPYFGPPGYGYYYAPLPPTYTTTRFPAIYWRLTFAPDGRLQQFKEVTR